jgi:hypothetical protein
MYDDPNIRNLVIDTVTGSLDKSFIDWRNDLTNLLDKVEECYSR